MKPISTEDQLPSIHSDVLFWHPEIKSWFLGSFYEGVGKNKIGYFQSDCTAWYVLKGSTYWMPEPPSPKAFIT